MEFATLTLKEVNVAADLMGKGLAKTMISKNSEELSPQLDQLMGAEKKAQASSQGMYSKKAAP